MNDERNKGGDGRLIVSASRRTDVPRFYAEWLFKRLAEGFVLVRNPMNPRQISRVPLMPETVDCLALWTKDPAPMLGDLRNLEPYPYYFQFALNPYGADVERFLPPVKKRVGTFRRLAEKIGRERTVWRYSPALISSRYTVKYHLEAFGRLASALHGYTETCNLSFVDVYRKIRRELERCGIREPSDEEKSTMVRGFAAIAAENDISLRACSEIGLDARGLPHAHCIDGELIKRISGKEIDIRKDPGQRGACGCVRSVDIGTYDTCLNGCAYCYANTSVKRARTKTARYDRNAPMLCDSLGPMDKITERRAGSPAPKQRQLFD